MKKKIYLTESKRKTITFYLLISPWIIGFLAFVLGPMIISLFMSFTKWDLLTDPKWIGFDNYTKMFGDSLFYQSLKVTFVYSIFSVPLQLILSLAVAMLLNQINWGVKVFRTIYYIPVIVSGVAVMVLWSYIFNPEIGLINQVLKMVGIKGPGWIFDEDWAMTSLVVMSLWNIGGTVVIWLAGLAGVSKDLYESATLDGANKWQLFRFVTLPALSPTLFYNLIMGVIGALQTFNQAYIMTDGGPNNSTLFYNYYLWVNAFDNFEMGYASAMAWILFIIIIILTLIIFKSSSSWVYYESERK
ncbi:sugar ABC transporter permease [Caldibacillus lycopersici]|uniref:Sugar ABC transporter permease n=1 Tax=Perspicuibacillus lycopersici TaxID=1325689 RepID=A0AAE3ITI4_9BACI|nr:sugar ABC transporter permease [Perspicuibacillus lycopersici]MCU9613174.1 sugar ABC transporter permease [Perspicuibacillus lycopersici]